MNILITGAKGFMGRNLCHTLRILRPEDALYEVDVDTSEDVLVSGAREADFVFHLAGVNRPENTDEFMQGNRDFTQRLMEMLENGKKPPVWVSSSIQAELDNPYGKASAPEKPWCEATLRKRVQRPISTACLMLLANGAAPTTTAR